MPTFNWGAERDETEVFCGLSDERLRAIEANLQAYRLEQGQLLWDSIWARATVFLLVEGTVKLFVETERGPAVLDFCGAGEVLELAMPIGAAPPLNAVALSPCRFSTMQGTLWHEHLLATPQLSLNLARIGARRLERSLCYSQLLLGTSVRGRLAHLLLHYAQRFGEPVCDGGRDGAILLPFVLSQREWAATIGASREGLQKALAELRKSRLISTNADYHIIVHNRDGLKKLCDRGIFLPDGST